MNSFIKVKDDICQTATRLEAALALAWMDIKLRFRGSVLGPFWFTLSIGAQIAIIGYIYPRIFGVNDQSYIKWLGTSLICWHYISFSINESVNVFKHSKHIYQNHKIPYTFFSLKSSLLGLFIFLLQLPILGVIWLLFGFELSISDISLFIIGTVFTFIFSFLINILIGILALRFHDIPQIISIGMNLAFLVTPIIWVPEMAGDRIVFLKYNPFYYLLETIRSPLLSRSVESIHYYGIVGLITFLALITFCIFAKYRSKIVYW